ncbi:MAG: peptidoglycan D,D-transpeptidase FtsI family protein [Phycisphaerales bacterium]
MTDRVALGVRVFGLLMLAAVIGRVVQLQAYPDNDLRAAIQARTTGSSIDSVRGDLLDRRGRLLATTRVGWRVVVDPVAVQPYTDRVIVTLAKQLEVSPTEIGLPVMRATSRNALRIQERGELIETPEPGGWLAGIGLVQKRAEPDANKGLIRYVTVSDVITRDEADAVRSLRITNKNGKAIPLPGVVVERRAVRELVGGDTVAPLMGKVGYKDWSDEREGKLGAERLFQDRLEGEDGKLRYVRDAKGRPLWVERGAWSEANAGTDVRLSIDSAIQQAVARELERGVIDADASGGRAIVFEPNTGEVLAMVDLIRDMPALIEVPWWDPASEEDRAKFDESVRYRVLQNDPGRGIEPALARNRCLEDIYEPGSTFKPFSWALAHEKGMLNPDDVLRPEAKSIRTWYNRSITDVAYKDAMTWDDVLRFSSNIGMYHITEKLGHEELRAQLLHLGFGSRTGLGLPGEASGLVTSERNWNKYTHTSVGMGYEVGVTPVQMVRGFSVFARRGDLAGTLPGVRLTADGLDQDRPGIVGEELFVERVYQPASAVAVREPLRAVVEKMDELRLRTHPDDVPARYSMFGKSGTAYIACSPPAGMERPAGAGGYFRQYNSSFIVAAPAENPEIVVLVVIDDPGPDAISKRRHYGSWVAGPVVRRVVEWALPYMGVPVDTGEPVSQRSEQSS